MRLRNKPWAPSYLAEHPEFVESSPELFRGKWAERFKNPRPLHIEVGTGKGRFVNEMASENKHVNYIGIEKYQSVIVHALDKLKNDSKSNLVLLAKDVENIETYFAPREVDRLYINFTDPWPKERHKKRRLTHPHFLSKYMNILADNGEIHFKTDNQALYEYSISSFNEAGFLLKNVSLHLHESSFEGNVMTEYEKKFSSKGMRIYRLEAYRKQN